MTRRRDWVLLAYRLPREPSAPRLAVWRKLKRLGVAQLLDGLVGLPLDSRNREQLVWRRQVDPAPRRSRLRAITSGDVILDGRPATPAERRAVSAAVLQRPLLGRGSALRNAELGLRFARVPREEA